MNLGKVKEIGAFVRKVNAILIDVAALSPGTLSPLTKRN